MKTTIIWGASGHAKVIYPILKKNSYQIVGMIDKDPTITEFISYPVYRSLEDFFAHSVQSSMEGNMGFAIAIGGTKGYDRITIHNLLTKKNLQPINLMHKTAWIADTATLGDGCQILAMAAVCEHVQIGTQTIINTNATVDHESVIGIGVHIMPGATIAGCVEIGDFATIGSNATVLPRIKIGKGSIIGAGAVVTKDVPENTIVIGIPAKIQEKET